MEEESKEYVDKIEAVDEKSITLLIPKITLRMKLRLKSRLKTIKCQKLVEDFTEYYIKVKDEPKDAFEEISGTENCMSGFRNYCIVQVYRSENHFGPSEMHVLMGVLATPHAQSVNGGPRYTYTPVPPTSVSCLSLQ